MITIFSGGYSYTLLHFPLQIVFDFCCYRLSTVLPKCASPVTSYYHVYWTAGIRPLYPNGTPQSYQWQPFPNVTQVVSATTPWNQGQPNAAENSPLSCIVGYVELDLEDTDCSIKLCALCEIDMP